MAASRSVELPERTAASVWRNRDFVLLTLGQSISALGGSMSSVVLPLLILSITGSPGAAGIAAALSALPYLLFSLPAGALIDRWDRKRVMIVCDTVRAVSLGSIPLAMAFGVLSVWQIYLTAFIEGTLYVFFNLADSAALPQVVRKEQLAQAAGINEASFLGSSLAGPPLGGLLYQTVGRAVPFLLDAVSYAVSVLTLLLIRVPFQAERSAERRDILAEIRAGVAWLWGQRLIRLMALVTGGFNMIGAGLMLLVVLLAQRFGATETQIGVLFGVAAGAGMLGALAAGAVQQRFSFGQVILGTLVLNAVAVVLLPLTGSVIALGLLYALAFAVGPVYNTVQYGYRAALIPDELQGRVHSAYRMVGFGFQPLGAALAGLLAERFGPLAALVLFGALALLLALSALHPLVRNAPPVE